MKYEIPAYIAACVSFIVVFVYLAEQHITIPKDFQCTESAIVNGVAECVKYEKKVEK